MRVFVDKTCVPPVLCFAAVCALTFLIIPMTVSAGHGGGGTGDKCHRYDSDQNGSLDGNDAVACIENLSAFPSTISSGESTSLSWNIDYQSSPPSSGAQCNLVGDPQLDTTLPGSEESPVSLDYGDFSSDSTTVVVKCEIGSYGNSNNNYSLYDDFEAGVTVTRESQTCDSSTCGWENQSCGGGSCSAGEMLRIYECSDGNCDDGSTDCVNDSSCSSSCNPPSPSQGCRVESVCGGDLSFSGSPSSNASEVETQQAESQSSDSPNSASLDVSSVPNADEEITDITVGYTASANCTLGGYPGESCSGEGDVTVSLGSQSESASASVSNDGSDSGGGTISNSGEETSINVDSSASASADKGSDNDSKATANGGAGVSSVSVEVCEDSNNDPTATNDPVSMKECTDSVTIDVLENDTDDDGDNIEIKSVENYPTNGTAFEDNGEIVYTPDTPDNSKDNEFSYTITDGNGGTGSAKVDVSFSSCQGSITVEIEDTNGNSVSAESIEVEYDGDVKNLGSGSSGSTDVDLKDSGADVVIDKSDIDPPQGYKVREDNWVQKAENEPTYNDPTRSELGF